MHSGDSSAVYRRAAIEQLKQAGLAFIDDQADAKRARECGYLADKIEALDPDLHRRLWIALPGHDEPAVRADDELANRVGVSMMVLHAALDYMRYPLHHARQAGGWWRAWGEIPS